MSLTLAYGEDDSSNGFQVDLGFVGDSNIGTTDECFVELGDDSRDRFTDVFQGGHLSGRVCYQIPERDLDSLVLYANADVFGDQLEFFALT